MSSYEHPPLPFGAHIGSDGIWCQVLNRAPDRKERGVLFLDRDGVIIEDVHYLQHPDDVQLIAGASDIIAAANARCMPVIVVTNQAGIGYGKFQWQHFIEVQERILQELDAQNAFVNAVFACPFHAKGLPPYQHPDHPCRKPNSGMLEKASQHFSIDWQNSWIIGDRAADLLAGRNAGVRSGIHVATGHGGDPDQQNAAQDLQSQCFDVYLLDSIAQAEKQLGTVASMHGFVSE